MTSESKRSQSQEGITEPDNRKRHAELTWNRVPFNLVEYYRVLEPSRNSRATVGASSVN